jgi:hypothetical protein
MNRFLLILSLFASFAPPAWAQSKPVLGIDSVSVIVKDLERTRADFRALGFSTQFGSLRANGVRNEFIRFPDGSEIQLISPTAALDQSSGEYLSWLDQGDGPIAFGLFRPGARPSPADRMFFGERAAKGPGSFEPIPHLNGAIGLSGIWLAGGAAEPRIAGFPGGRVIGSAFCTPIGSASKAVQFKEGFVVLMPRSAQLIADRPVVAITVAVEKLVLTQGFLDGARVRFRQEAGCGRPSLWVETHGLWLEFRER